MGGKMLEVLREVAPQVSRVAVILNLDQPPQVAIWHTLEATAAPSFGVRVTAVDMHSETPYRLALWRQHLFPERSGPHRGAEQGLRAR